MCVYIYMYVCSCQVIHYKAAGVLTKLKLRQVFLVYIHMQPTVFIRGSMGWKKVRDGMI